MGSVGSSLPSYDYDNPTKFTDNPTSTTKWFNNEKLSNYAEWKDGLTTAEKSAISSFTGSGYKSYNMGQLYDTDWGSMDEQQKEYAGHLYDAISKFELRKPITVYRKATTELFGMDGMSMSDLKSLEGQIVHSNGFMSTSAGTQGIGINSSECQMKIIIPKSVGAGAWVANHSVVGTSEREFLLNNNGFFKIDKVSKGTNGKPFIEMRWVGQSKDQIFAKDTNPVINKSGFTEKGKKGTISTKTVGKTVKKKK